MTIEYFSEMFQVDENTLEVDGTTITNKLVFNNINVSVRYFEENQERHSTNIAHIRTLKLLKTTPNPVCECCNHTYVPYELKRSFLWSGKPECWLKYQRLKTVSFAATGVA